MKDMDCRCIEFWATVASPVISTIAVFLSCWFARINSKEANQKITVLKDGFNNEITEIKILTRSVILLIIHDLQEKGYNTLDELKHNSALIEQDLDRLQQIISSDYIENPECLYDNEFLKKRNEEQDKKNELDARIALELETENNLKEKYKRISKTLDYAAKLGDQTFKQKTIN
mgnify:CR=1 FL=1